MLVRFGGAAAAHQARAAADRLGGAGLDDPGVVEDDDELWAGQRARQRAPDGAVLKVAGTLTDLPAVLRAAEAGGATAVSRASLGLSWVALGPARTSPRAPTPSAPRCPPARAPPCSTAAAPCAIRGRRRPPAALVVMERIKARFDPARVFRPGAFVEDSEMATRAWDDTRPPELDLIRDCVHCGFCLPTCPSYARRGGRDGLPARAHPADADRPRGGRVGLARDDRRTSTTASAAWPA